MSKIDTFVNRYQISKTLRFSLIPIGKTEEHFNAKKLLEEDKKRADEYVKVKKLIDRYHKHYIESVLSSIVPDGVTNYAELYYKIGKNENEIKEMERCEAALRKSISNALTKTDEYKSLFGKDIIEKILPEYLKDEGELASVEMFRGFTTYFIGFNENRKNMYTDEPQSTAIAYRCINENLPKFLDNIISFKTVCERIPLKELEEIDQDFSGVFGVSVRDLFCEDYFSFVLSQTGIDKYNGIIGGYTCSDGTKIKGLNERINLFNQQFDSKEKSKRIPLMKPLYKQILSDRETVSFIPEMFATDDEVISSVNEYFSANVSAIDGIANLFSELDSYDDSGIFITSGTAVTDISNSVFGIWSAVSEGWNRKYQINNPIKKGRDPEKYFEDIHNSYTSVADAVDLIGRFDDIRYNAGNDYFEFDIDFSRFERANASFRKHWTVCTNGERIRTFRNQSKNNEWDNETVVLSEEYKKLFDKNGIDYLSENLKAQILARADAPFFKELISLLALTLQMRNSITGNTETDYLISPVRNADGEFYDSRNYTGSLSLPANADANGAYNIARKALWAIDVLRNTPDDELKQANLSIKNADWLEYAQK